MPPSPTHNSRIFGVFGISFCSALRLFIEGLQDHAALALADTGVALAQLGTGGTQPAFIQQLVFQVGFDTWELLGLLGFDVQAGFVLRVAFGDLDDVVQGEDLQADEAGRARSG
jgi:hypothetical protein